MLAIALFSVVFFLTIDPLTSGLSFAASHVVLLNGLIGGVS